MNSINFKAKLVKINSWTVLHLPKEASAKLSSRGMNFVEGTINGFSFHTPLEPDGKGSHWFRVENNLGKTAGADVGDTVTLEIEAIKKWPDPKMPDDVKTGFKADPRAYEVWMDITTNARWDWLRWINSTKNPETRKIRIQKMCSKLKSGIRNACCFNRSQCTETSVSKNGVLLDPTD